MFNYWYYFVICILLGSKNWEFVTKYLERDLYIKNILKNTFKCIFE